MFTTALIAFREFLEAFLIVGVFLGVSRKLQLKKETEILLAAITGISLSLVLNISVFALGDQARTVLTERNADALESYLQIFSGFFVAYVVFSLHKRMSQQHRHNISKAEEQLKSNMFDVSLFLTIVFLVVREGFEIALFTASITLFSVFVQNFVGLILGFICASVIGVSTFFAYLKFSIGKIFKATEYLIILLGAALFQTGITRFLDTHFNVQLSNLGSFHLQFLPDEDSFVGSVLQGFFGIDQGFSFFRLLLMVVYIGVIYLLFIKEIDFKKKSVFTDRPLPHILASGSIGLAVIGMGVLSAYAFTNQQSQSTPMIHAVVKETDLVSSITSYAPKTDSTMTDAWGMEFGHKGRIWVNTSSGYSEVYNGSGDTVQTKDTNSEDVALRVQIPTPANSTDPAPVTGMVFSDSDAFAGDSFVFVTEQGTISGWHKNEDGTEPLQATMRVDNSAKGAVYKGVTAAKTKYGWLLYTANFAQNRVDIFDQQYHPVMVLGGFEDPNMPKDYAPFNIKNSNDELYVTYAKQSIDKQNDVKGTGNGYIDVYDLNGRLVKRFASNGVLNSPWGIALAPNDFGVLSNTILVGNFGDGHINAFDKNTGASIGDILTENNIALQIDGLWALTFGTDNGAGKHNELFFSAGSSAEDQGLFGKLELLK